MGRNPLPDKVLKKQITIRLQGWMIDKLREQENYNKLLETLLEDYFKGKN